MAHDTRFADCRIAFITTRSISEGSPEQVARFQARRVDKSNAGGVSHRYANKRNLRPGEAVIFSKRDILGTTFLSSWPSIVDPERSYQVVFLRLG
jgi:hypothetical protein